MTDLTRALGPKRARGWFLATLAALALMVSSLGLIMVNASMRAATIDWMQAGPVRAAIFNLAQGVRLDPGVMVPVAESVSLSTNVMRPWWATGPVPTILITTPYGKGFDGRGFVRRGFAVVVQDMRGRYGSQGTFIPYARTASDAAATMDWIVAQPWSNGSIGTWGCSSLGEAQLAIARVHHPAHRAMVPDAAGGAVGPAGGRFSFGVYQEGVLQLASTVGWFSQSGERTSATKLTSSPQRMRPVLDTLPVLGMVDRIRDRPDTDFDMFIRTPFGDPQWQKLGFLDEGDSFTTAGLHINGWYDQTVSETLFAADFVRRNASSPTGRSQHVIIGPGGHCESGLSEGKVGDLTYHNADQPFRDELYLRWYASLLRSDGVGLPELPAYQVFVLNENRWVRSATWPPEQVRIAQWYLTSGGRANTREGDGALLANPPTGPLVADRFEADPLRPVPTRGGAFCCVGGMGTSDGPVDQADVERRSDVLVYTSGSLPEPIRIVGPLSMSLEVASSARDTDFVAKLVDVWPDGRTVNVQSGVMRLRYRNGLTRPQLAEPGRRYTVRMRMRDIAYLIPAGHRLRVQIAGSDFPRLERNLNTGGRNYDEVTGVIAENRVYHGAGAASFIALPVLDRIE